MIYPQSSSEEVAPMASDLRIPPVVGCMEGILAGLRPEHGGLDRRPDVSQLAASFADLAVIVADSGWRGLPELLRLIATALRQRAVDTVGLSDAEVAHLVEWLEAGRAYCSGRLPASLTATLVESLQSLNWVPEIPGRMRDLIVQRLLASASPPAISDEHVQPADHRLATTLDDSVLTASNTTLDERTTETGLLLGSDCTASTQSASVATSPWGQDDESVHESVGTPASTTPIWISEDELSLAAQAVTEQLMPLSQALFDASTVEQRGPLIEDLAYHTRLIGGALELLGLVALHRATDIVLDEIDDLARRSAGDLDASLGLLLRWQVALLGFLQTAFDRDAQDLLLETLRETTWSRPLDDSVANDVAVEFANIAVGRDPDAKLHRVVYAGPEDVALTPASDVLPSVLDGMLSELPGNARQLSARLHAVAQNGNPDDVDVARRVAHTLKGDANTVGIRGIANLTHAIEDILGYLAKSSRSIESGLADLLGEAADCVDAMADHVLGRGPAPDDALDILQRVSATAEALFEGLSILGNETFVPEAAASRPADQAQEGPGRGTRCH